MAVLGNSDGCSVAPADMQQSLEVDDDYNKYTPSADYNSTSGLVFRNKKFTKKRHESKTRRTEQDPTVVCCSDEDYPSGSTRHVDLHLHRSIPKMMMSINQTIKEMSLKDNSGTAFGGGGGGMTQYGAGGGTVVKAAACFDQAGGIEGDSTTNFEADDSQPALKHNILSKEGVNQASCSMQPQPQGKRRRHRRKQQYKRMAVDVLNDKKLKGITSNSSEDSGIGKRKRNIILSDNKMLTTSMVGSVSVPVPVSSFGGYSTTLQPQQAWPLEDGDTVMMDCDDAESSSMTRLASSTNSQGILVTEEESVESDTQNDDIESLSDPNQDADDEESDYYNNDSSTTSLSESSFTILSPSKKFIPVHSREIRSGRRRLKTANFNAIENEELSKFLQNPKDTVLKAYPSSEKERQDFINVASLYSLSYEESCDQDDQRVWIQLTKTPKTTTQRRNDLIKSGDRSSSHNFSDACSLAPIYDTCVTERREGGENSDGCIDEAGCSRGNNVGRSGINVNQSVNSKRIKKGC